MPDQPGAVSLGFTRYRSRAETLSGRTRHSDDGLLPAGAGGRVAQRADRQPRGQAGGAGAGRQRLPGAALFCAGAGKHGVDSAYRQAGAHEGTGRLFADKAVGRTAGAAEPRLSGT